MKVFCVIYSEKTNSIMTTYEKKSGLRGLPKEKIWEDEINITPDIKASKMMHLMGFEDLPICQIFHLKNDVFFVYKMSYNTILTCNKKFNLKWESLNKDFPKLKYNSSIYVFKKYVFCQEHISLMDKK